MHGPQAFANTVAPIASRSASRPSRSIVARICSEPGVISNSVFALRPFEAANRATLAARVMSSYELFVQLPISADEISSGHLFSAAALATPAPTRWARSGVCGPLINGVSFDRSISIVLSYKAPSSGRRCSATSLAAAAISLRPVARK